MRRAVLRVAYLAMRNLEAGLRRTTSAPTLYFGAQAIIGAGWWVTIVMFPEFRSVFFPEGFPAPAWIGLAFGDSVLFIGASCLIAILLHRGSHWWSRWLIAHLGASAYATLYALGVALVSESGWLGVAAMAISVCASAFVGRVAWIGGMPSARRPTGVRTG